MKFESELKKGRFVCSECQKCNKLVWPPSDFCNVCFNEVKWRGVSTKAKLVEFSRRDDVIFCIAEFENTTRVMGSLEADFDRLRTGLDLSLIKCDYDKTEKFVFGVAN